MRGGGGIEGGAVDDDDVRVLGQRGGEEPGGDVTEAPLYCTGWLVGWLVGGGERGWLQGPELDVGSGAGVRTRVYEYRGASL